MTKSPCLMVRALLYWCLWNRRYIVRFKHYMNWLSDIGLLLEREVKPSPLAVELYNLEASPEDVAIEYGEEI
ncbi:hypothetical protein PHYNN_232 [Pantoea phage Phynn]|nr:hypothetical protein PHYNN_232 [Pantoea phage Phynn]